MLPCKKISKSKTHSRRAHHRLKPVNYSVCPKCGQAKLPHAACDKCGYLNSKITLNVAKAAEKE
jgi:large subunit ribosomal protein L32